MEQLSARLAAATREVHARAESSAFITELLAGRLPASAYAGMLAQHYYIYAALERTADQLRSHPVAGQFVFDDLARLPALDVDLPWLLGHDWRLEHAPTVGTQAYADRIVDACTRWPTAFIAHHYTRYIGDLSGGRIIKTLVSRTYGFAEDGVRFYSFSGIAKPKRFKDAYRRRLDAIDLTDAECDELTDEAITAFRHNITVFEELEQCLPRQRDDVIGRGHRTASRRSDGRPGR
ncbi:MAG: biliverdin-producing heme oxygenase [Streptosporangiales bacterium]|nr:biliverdin-producing heme oxygenase [Streptosporangiales bacterium]